MVAQTNLVSLTLAFMLGCSEDPVQMEWTLDVTFQSTDCGLSDNATFWLLRQDDGTFGTAVLLDDGTQFDAEDSSGRYIAITIVVPPTAASQRRFDRIELGVTRTPGADEAFPDMLEGAGFVERMGTCRDELTFTGIGVPDDSTCNPTPDDVQLCATEQAFSWSFR